MVTEQLLLVQQSLLLITLKVFVDLHGIAL